LDETRYSAAEAKGIIPVHPNCLPGDSLISPRGRITAASKRWYKGKIHIIKTATGRIIRATPNHPILSNRGFVPANSLDIGSQVISHGLRQGESFSDWQDINKPTTIKDIAESFFASPGVSTKEVPVSAPDFHYDGTGSNIAIIGTDSLLSDGRNASNKQLSLNNNLVFRDIAWSLFDRFCMFAFGRPAYSSTLSRIMSSFNLFLSLLKTHLRPLESAISKMQSNTIFGPSGNVQIDNLCNDFFVDSVVHINSLNFSNYVYNLETTESYYIANGIASHNCRCALLPVVNDLSPCQGSPGEVANASCIMPDKLHDGQVQSLLNKLEEAGPAESSKISRALRKLGHKGGLSGKPSVGKIPTVKPTKPVVAKPAVTKPLPKTEKGWKPSMDSAQAEKWAKNSKAPDMLWHGTSTEKGAKSITSQGFELSKVSSQSGNGGFYGRGIYLTPEKYTGESYAQFNTRRLLQLKVNIKKPLVWESKEAQTIRNEIATMSKGDIKKLEFMLPETFKEVPDIPSLFTKLAQKRGYDSVVKVKTTYGTPEWVIFNPKNITVIKG